MNNLGGNRTGAVPDQNREEREAANEVGMVVQGGITRVRCSDSMSPALPLSPRGPPNDVVPGPPNLELRVFDSQGNLLTSNTYVFPQNQNGDGITSSFFDLNAAQLPASAFDNTGRAQVTGILRAIPGPHQTVVPGPPDCGFVASGEIFSIGDGRTLVHIAGTPISRCREAA